METMLDQEIIIDEEFKSLCPPLSEDEFNQLMANILSDGCRDPLVIWKEEGILLDGHHRHSICLENDIPFRTVEISLLNRDTAKDWIIRNQLGRRNLTPTQWTYLLGLRYNLEKKEVPNPEGIGGKSGKIVRDQFDPQQKTAERLADEYGVSAPTVKRAGQFAEAVEQLKPHVPDIQERVMEGDIPSRAAVIEAAKEPDKAEEKLKPHVAHNSGNNEWYTPPEFIEAARAVMGGIDCDPASSEIANETVQAKKYYTAEDDGRNKEWGERVWMNPPYAQPLIAEFCNALLNRVEYGDVNEACVLVNNATETTWFQNLLSVSSAVCLVKGRIRFLNPDGNTGAPLQGQCIIYIGKQVEKFNQHFKQFGCVLYCHGV